VTLLQLARDSGVPKLTAGVRSLRERLGAYGVKGLPSAACLKDFVPNATEAVAPTPAGRRRMHRVSVSRPGREGAPILLWTSSDETHDRAVWEYLIVLAQKHALPRAWAHLRARSGTGM
jgi:hypothetical protein